MLGKKATQEDWYKAFLGFDEVLQIVSQLSFFLLALYRGYLLFRSQVLNCPNWLVGWIGGEEVEVGNQHSRQNISQIPSALMFVVNPRHFCQGDGGSG